jgi:hypothetical protein
MHKNGEVKEAVLTMGSNGRCGSRGGLVVVNRKGGGFFSRTRGLELGKAKRIR